MPSQNAAAVEGPTLSLFPFWLWRLSLPPIQLIWLIGNIILIAGGQTKGANFSELITALKPLQCQLILLGEGADEISSLVVDQHKVSRVDSLEQAVSVAESSSKAGDMVLLSPACASFDMFSGFEQRGDSFKTAVSCLGGQQ